MENNEKWVKFDAKDMVTWPKKSGYYFITFAKSRDDKEGDIEIVHYLKNDYTFKPGSWDTYEDEEWEGGYDIYYYKDPIEIPEF